ncbi:hypothetical protein NU08_3415 [Flavobacterium anhuiense]|uniref:Uncharacterized protein n=1 Tax=Flavobacterium anhuiense TaxID=459526 RepID=A0A444VVB9_9FLAO|nr:hypothetical protein NU08_3415 [Flavobacterium anhuiense]
MKHFKQSVGDFFPFWGNFSLQELTNRSTFRQYVKENFIHCNTFYKALKQECFESYDNKYLIVNVLCFVMF